MRQILKYPELPRLKESHVILGSGYRRNHEVKLRLTPEEKETLDFRARSFGLKTSQFIRFVSLNCSVEIKEK